MRNLNLQSRILLLFVALLLGIQMVSFFLIRQAIEENAKAAISSQLAVGERVFLRVLHTRAARLADSTELLASDFGFRSALASRDAPTIASALDNQRERVKASFAYYFSPSFQLIGSSGSMLSPKAIAGLRSRAAASSPSIPAALPTDGVISLVAEGDNMVQFAIAPVNTPTLMGWVAIGFPVNQSVLDELKTLSGFDVALVMSYDGWAAKSTLSSLDDLSDRNDLSQALSQSQESRRAQAPASQAKARAIDFSFPETLELGASVFGSRLIPLSNDPASASFAVLMQSIDKAREPYTKLQLTLVALGVVGCFTFFFGALLLSRSITRPIVELSRAAEGLARGDYTSTIPEGSPGELGELASSFERMRVALGERESKINRLAYWDTLTDLPNREQFRERLSQMLDRCAKADPPLPCTVAFLDLDRIKNVNDALGQPAGDELLREVARRLSATAIPQDGMAARLSGDKFALLLPGAGREQAETIAERVHQQFQTPATIGQSRIDISAGIGICCVPTQATTVEQAMSRAEVAMYAAKLAKSSTVFYDPKLDSSSEDSLSLLSDLREAILNKDLRLHYQPKADFATGRIVGAEALARWNHPLRGPMPPYSFIPFAEQTGFIGQITQWAVDETCMMIARMHKRGQPIKISANISTRDLLDHQFLDNLKASLAQSGANPALLCLEVTESALMDNPERSLQAMSSIRALGVELSIDDFGTGYSSLGYLRRMPINEIKIDRVFIVGLTSGSATDEKIVASTIELAHGLGLRVVAEGTEEPLAFAKLRAAGCDLAQGFGVSRPVPEQAFIEFLAEWKPSHMPG